jgi:hypothetical protein
MILESQRAKKKRKKKIKKNNKPRARAGTDDGSWG